MHGMEHREYDFGSQSGGGGGDPSGLIFLFLFCVLISVVVTLWKEYEWTQFVMIPLGALIIINAAPDIITTMASVIIGVAPLIIGVALLIISYAVQNWQAVALVILTYICSHIYTNRVKLAQEEQDKQDKQEEQEDPEAFRAKLRLEEDALKKTQAISSEMWNTIYSKIWNTICFVVISTMIAGVVVMFWSITL